ncbi:hypothetical protein PENSPDRAFT_631815 [Peniophora sp. CONT]|nr:hypothetical protein PENSPDRAFT_631815 [Peniophora sp. CONT]
MAPSPTPTAASRRKSIAVTSASSAESSRPVHKRRAHSIAPGDKVSPRTRARRLKGPRKSILKVLPLPDDTLEFTTSTSASSRMSLSRRVSFAPDLQVRMFEKDEKKDKDKDKAKQRRRSSAALEDEDVRDGGGGGKGDGEKVSDENAGVMIGSRRRSSLRAPRVSEYGEMSMDVDGSPIASTSYLDAPDSSPLPAGFLDNLSDGSVLPDEEDEEEEGVTRGGGRRSTLRFADDDEDMDEDEEGDDMDITQSVPRHSLARRRRSSTVPHLGAPPLEDSDEEDPLPDDDEHVPIDEDDDEEDEPLPDEEDDDQAPYDDEEDEEEAGSGEEEEDEGEQVRRPIEHVEYSAPLEQPLSRPRRGSEAAILALAAATHSGLPSSTPTSSQQDAGGYEDMDLEEAQTRLIRMRESLGLSSIPDDTSNTRLTHISEESMSFDEDDDVGGDGIGDETVNMTRLRQSLGASEGGSEMDITAWHRDEDEGTSPSPPSKAGGGEAGVFTARRTSFAAPSTASSHAAPSMSASTSSVPAAGTALNRSVFAPPPRAGPSQPQPQPPARATSPTRSKLPVPSSPTKNSPRKAGSAAFAGPVSKPVPKRYPSLAGEDLAPTLAPPPQPTAGPSSQPTSGPSQSQSTLLRTHSDPSQLGKSTNQIPSLGRSSSHDTHTQSAAQRRASVSGLRRPSNFFAQRKSLGLGGGPPPPPPTTSTQEQGEKAVEVADDERGDREREDREDREREERERAKQKEVVQTSPSGYIRGSPVRVRHTRTSNESSGGGEVGGDVFGTPPRIEVQTENEGEGADFPDDDDFPAISIEQFMSLTDVSFIQDIFVPPVPIRPSLAPRGSLGSGEAGAADCFVAMHEHLPQLELYGRVVEDMERWSGHAAEVYAQAEADALRVQPSLFREFVEADEEIQRELVGHLKRYQRHCRAKVKLQWRQWRLGWVNELKETADKGFTSLTSDATKLEALNKEAQSLLTVLRENTAKLEKEYEEEQAFADALAQDDPEYLDELKATIAEQESVLQAFRDEKTDNDAALESLERRIAELEASNQQERDAIARLERPEEPVKDVAALRDELAMLEDLTMFKITRIRPYGWSLIYANRYVVDAPSTEYVPSPAQLRISLTHDAREYTMDEFPALTELATTLPSLYFASTPSPRSQPRTMKHITQFLRDFWSGCAQIRTQLRFLAVKWPLEVVVEAGEGKRMPGMRATADVVLHSVKAKIKMEFVFEAETVIGWPFSVQDVACAVRPVYGSGFDCERICADIVERISEARPDNAHGCIVDACIVATADYARRSRGSTSMNTSA